MHTHGSAASPRTCPIFFEWQHACHAAVLESDRHKLLERIRAAEDAIFRRLQEMPGNSDTVKRQTILTR